jgi:Leucine-rich repeat (LRR) protein
MNYLKAYKIKTIIFYRFKMNKLLNMILLIQLFKESFQDTDLLITISSNTSLIDLSQIQLSYSTKIITENNLYKTVTNTNKTENKFIKKIVLSGNFIEYVDKFTFLNFVNLEEVDLGQNRIQSTEISFGPSVKILRLADNQISEINSESFKDLNQLFVLEIHFNKIQIIKNDTFSGLSAMEYLIMFRNLIHTIEDNSFAAMKKIKFLYLFSNKLEKIHNKMFRNLFSLAELLLFENDMIEIESESFIDLVKLEKLHLFSNKLRYLNNLTFVGLYSLRELWLQKNELKQIGPIFSNLVNLNYIVFDNNKLESVDQDCFRSNENLIKIEVFSNGISRLNNLNIENLSKLDELNLNNNLLMSNFPLNNTRMTILHLKNNRITEFREKLFLPNLKILFVSNNRVQSLTNEIFIHLKEAEEIDFSINRIILIEKMTFKGLVSLKRLNLSKNYLETNSHSDYFVPDLTLLEILDLSYNYFYYFNQGFFKNLKQLKHLWLNNNNIKEISSSLFVENLNLVNLYLSSNKLKAISLNHSKLEILELKSNQIKKIKSEDLILPYLKKLHVSNNLNLLELNLKDVLLLEFFDLSNNYQLKNLNSSIIFDLDNLKNLKMKGPYEVSLEKIFNLNQLVEIDLSFNTILSGNFTLKYHKKLQKVKVRQMKNFTTFDLLINPNLKEVDFSQNSLINQFSIFDILEKIEILELSQVGLAEIVELKLELFHDLSKLDLSYNFLTYLNESTFTRMSKLTYLDLSFNRIKHLDVNIFKWLHKLVYLNVEQNIVGSLGDVLLNYLDIETLKLANNSIEKLPEFLIKTHTDHPAPLREIDMELNRCLRIKKFSNSINGIQLLKFDSNNISTIDYDAFIYLTSLKSLSLSKNSLKNLTSNNFISLFSLEHLNLSMNKITYIEARTFENLNKLITLDISQNLLISLDADVFYGLKSLKNLHIKGFIFKVNNHSFNHLSNINNIFFYQSIIEENECLLIESLKRFIIKESFFCRDQIRQINRSYYRSLNFLSSLTFTNKSCDMKLFFLQFNFHLNLMSDNDVEDFYVECGNFIIKKENHYSVNKFKCDEPRLYILNMAKKFSFWYLLSGFCLLLIYYHV